MPWASDTFAGGSKGDSIGASWTTMTSIGFALVKDGAGNAIGNSTNYSGNMTAAWTGTGVATSADQIARVTAGSDDADSIGACVRMDNANGDMYCYRSVSNGQVLFEVNNTVFTSIGTSSIAFTTGDIIEVRAIGDQISGYINGVLRVGPVTNTTVTVQGLGAGLLIDDDVGDYATPAVKAAAWAGGDSADDPGIGGGTSVGGQVLRGRLSMPSPLG